MSGKPAARAPQRPLIIACGAIAHELVAVLRADGLEQAVDIECLPAEWHNTPERICPAVQTKLESAALANRLTFVAYGDCGTGGRLDALLERFGVERLPGPHCYDFFAGHTLFEALSGDEIGTFWLTDYLARNFRRLILDGFGISKHPELLDMMFAHYTRVVWLTQDVPGSDRQALEHAARDAAAALGLPLEIESIGLAPFHAAMRHGLGRIPVISRN